MNYYFKCIPSVRFTVGLIFVAGSLIWAQQPGNVSVVFTGISPSFAGTSAFSTAQVPAEFTPSLQATAVGQVPLTNLVIKPGLSAPISGTQALDSDTNLAVGDTQVLQWADFQLQAYDKSINPIGGTVAGNAFWSGNSPCSVAVGADGIAQYDKMAQRFLVAMRTGLNDECIAVSQTDSATGQYYQYLVNYTDSVNPGLQMDYPKIGVWPDAYYLTFDMLDPANNFAPQYGVVCALNRQNILSGVNAQAVCLPTQKSNTTGFFHLMPSDLDSSALPPVGAPNYILTFAKPVGATAYHLYLYKFHVDFGVTSKSTLTGPLQIDTNAFAGYLPACNAGAINCVPQPPPAVPPKNTLDSLGGYLMYRLAYRHFSNYENLVITQAVQTTKTSPVGVRWYEIRNMSTTPSIYQSGFLAPDSFSRWMSSAAMDSLGNLAVGYSIAGNPGTSYYSGFPGIALNGRLASTPLNNLLTENIVFPGVTSEVGKGRWGAVSSMVVDPSDQCTLWYANQYQPVAGDYDWATQIMSFRFSDCGSSGFPTISSISPVVGSTAGGTLVTINGTNFLSGAVVHFGQAAAASSYINSTTLQATAPPSATEGVVTVSVTNPGNSNAAKLLQSFTYHYPPSLTSITPSTSPVTGGSKVTLAGQNFRCAPQCPSGIVVTFGGVAAPSVVFNNNASLTVVTPAHAAGPVSVTVSDPDGQQTTLASGFAFGSATISQISPNIGPIGGGNSVTITGVGFVNPSSVTFGTKASSSVTFVSSTQLTAIAPSQAAGLVDVTVASTGGTVTAPASYQYSSAPIVTGVSPASGSMGGGTAVSLTGYLLSNTTSVLFGGTPGVITAPGLNKMVVTTPAYSGTGNGVVDITLVSPNGTTTVPGGFSYTFGIVTKGMDDGYLGVHYSNTLTTAGGTGPVTWAVTSGKLPAGVSLKPTTGIINGVPTAPYNTYTFTVKATDSASPPHTSTATFSFNILFGFQSTPIPPTFFGMVLYDQVNNWPAVQFGALGKGLGTTWPFIEQVQGTYNWTVLDQYVADAQAHTVPGTSTPLSLYFTNANVPPWAAKDTSTCSSYAGTNPPIQACTSMVNNIQDFDNFMTALVTRYLGTIQIYELWNEPNVANVWTGSYADMVTLTAHEYNDIRSINPSAIILSPSSTAAPWLQSYMETPGAPLGVDAVAIHGYPNVGDIDAPEAIVGFKSVNIKLTMAAIPGLGVKPIWDTESSWGGQLAITDMDMRVAFVLRSLLLHWSVGIQRYYWYGWDSPVWGELWYPPPTGETPAGFAYNVGYNWMEGASMPAPCSQNGGTTFNAVYSCQLTRPGGYTALAVWDTNQSCSNGVCTTSNYTPPAQYIQYQDATGVEHAITPGQTIQIGAKPILLENMTAPAQ